MICSTNRNATNQIRVLCEVTRVVLIVIIVANLLLAAFCHHWHAFLPSHQHQTESAGAFAPVDLTHNYLHDSHAPTTNATTAEYETRSRLADPDKVPFGSDLLSSIGSYPMLVTEATLAIHFTPHFWWILVVAVLVLPAAFLPPPEKPPSFCIHLPASALHSA